MKKSVDLHMNLKMIGFIYVKLNGDRKFFKERRHCSYEDYVLENNT
jgi:hypothetical protein